MINSRFIFVGLLGVAGLLAVIKPATLLAQVRTEVSYQNSNGKMMVEVIVNNVKGHFLLDTGAPCALTYTFASKLGVTVQGGSVKVEDSNGNQTDTHICRVETLKLGDATFTDLQMVRLPKGQMIESFGVDGIIGYNLMKQGIVKFDGKKNLFTFTTYDKDLGIDYGYAIPLINDPYVTLLPVRLGKNSCDTVMFDSGARAFYEISVGCFDRLGEYNKDVRRLCHGEGILSLGVAGLEQKSMKYRLLVPDFKIGKRRFADVTSVTTNASFSRLGAEILYYGTVIIDYPAQVFYYIPHEPKKKLSLYQKDWDVTITVMDKSLCAGLVWSDSKSGLHGGERIVEINGIRYDQEIDLLQMSTKPLINLSGDKAEIGYIDERGIEMKTVIRRR